MEMQACTETIARTTPYSVLDRLVMRIDAAVRNSKNPEQRATAAATALRPFLGHPRLLEPSQCEPDPERYRQHVLHVAPDGLFSLVALVWMPGQETAVHDHVAWCAFGVHRGCEREVSFEVVEGGGETWLQPIGTVTNRVGSVSALVPPGDVHTVINPGPEVAISLHIYGADVRAVGTSIRRRYDLPVRLEEPILAFVHALASGG
jgi:predicted metal-dependent enzyme (double-stranded beta helix superfamily)